MLRDGELSRPLNRLSPSRPPGTPNKHNLVNLNKIRSANAAREQVPQPQLEERSWRRKPIPQGPEADPAGTRKAPEVPGPARAPRRRSQSQGEVLAHARSLPPGEGGGTGAGAGAVTSAARVAPAAQEQLVPLKTAGKRTAVGCWGPAAPRCGSRRLSLAPLHHVRPAGALRARVARAGGRISGAAGKAGPPGPSTRLPELQDLPLPAPPARAVGTLRAQGCPWPGPGGWWSAWTRPLHLPALQFFTHLGRPLEAPIPPALAPALGTSFAAESWSVASEGKFQACPCGGGLRGQVCALPPPPQGSPLTPPFGLWQLNCPSVLGSSPPLRLCWEDVLGRRSP